MNPILYFPKSPDEQLKPSAGSGRYYARLSQTETIPAPVSGGLLAAWIFEAFDAQWFDQNLELPSASDWIEYYERVPVFVLELLVDAGQSGHFGEFKTIQSFDKDENEPEEWFSITAIPTEGRALGEGETPVFIYSNLYQPGIPASLKDIGQPSKEISERLQKTASTAHIPDAKDKDVDTALNKIGKIDYAVVYDVGQGNAIGFCNSHNSVEAYLDLGGGVTRNAFTFPSALKNFCFTNRPPIILTHWDFDHWSSAHRDANSLNSTWIAPRQSVGPTHVALMASIMKSGTLCLLSPTFPSGWRNQFYLEHCTGKGRNHSGLALTLSEKSKGAGDHMLFPGDARYDYIPSFGSAKKYLSVVAPHHGADMKKHLAPTCPTLPASRLVYSFGAGNSFRHPRLATRTDHSTQGWRDPNLTSGAPSYEVRETASRLRSMLGHVLMAWKTWKTPPLLPCGGASPSCQLQAQQL
jgi:hypothetical protein